MKVTLIRKENATEIWSVCDVEAWMDKLKRENKERYISQLRKALPYMEGKRGYLNRFTGEVILPAIYSRAWVFSEGLAAVEKDNKLVFIDHSGKVVIDNELDVHFNEPHYAFHDGYCVVKNAVDGKSGLIDREGNWALQPEYDEITHNNKFWKVEKDDLHGLFSEHLDTLYAVENPNLFVYDDYIEVRFPDHTAKHFDYEGNVLVDFVVDAVENMNYPTTELLNEKNEDNWYYNQMVYAVAKCQRYAVQSGRYVVYYGLMDRNGKRITPPDYTSIDAIGEDLYLCQPQGFIINGKGQRVE